MPQDDDWVHDHRAARGSEAREQRQPHQADCRACERLQVGTRVAFSARVESNEVLRFIEADRVDTPAGRLNGFTLVSPTDAQLGKVDGVLVDPTQRQVCYYVVKTPGRFLAHRYLLPVMPAHLEAETQTLQIDVEPAELKTFPETDPESYSKFSDVDAVEAMFAKRAGG